MVHDLNFPPRQSVNSGTAQDEYLSEPFHLCLSGIDRLVEFINCKRPQVRRQFYFHTVMLFGLHSATLACQQTTKAVSCILNKEGILVDIYIDDFYRAETQELADLSFDCMT